MDRVLQTRFADDGFGVGGELVVETVSALGSSVVVGVVELDDVDIGIEHGGGPFR